MGSSKGLIGAKEREPSERLPGRKPGPLQRAEMMRIWDAVDDEGRKFLLFVGRHTARDQGLIAPNASLVITDRAF